MLLPSAGCRVSCLLLVSIPVLFPSPAIADGGALRLSEQKGNYQIAIFTSPTPLRAGPVDVSALVQDAVTHEPVSDVRVTVKVARIDRPGVVIRQSATNEAATNKLFQAATLNLNQPGWWHLEVSLDGPLGTTEVDLDMEAASPLPKYFALWQWLTWPALPILLFCAHQFLARQRSPGMRRLEDLPHRAAT
jgi:hypothetical protein